MREKEVRIGAQRARLVGGTNKSAKPHAHLRHDNGGRLLQKVSDLSPTSSICVALFKDEIQLIDVILYFIKEWDDEAQKTA